MTRESTSILYVQNWFRRLVDFASQAPLLREALDKLGTYKHPWCGNAQLKVWATAKHGTEWTFNQLTHHTSKMLAEIRETDPGLANTLQVLWAGNDAIY